MTIVTKSSLTLSNVNDGTITHTAYAYSADGTDGFTTVYPNLNLLDDTTFKNGVPQKHLWTSDGTGEKYLNIAIKNGGVNNSPYVSMSNNNPTANIFADPIYWNFNKDYFKPSTTYTFSFYLRGNGTIRTHVYPTLIDSSGANGLADGKVIIPAGDGAYDWNLTSEWVRHTYTFITRSSITEKENFLFRILSGNSADVCLPKVEPGSIATPYMQSASEVTTADWPKYRGEYSDMSTEQSTNPSDYTWSLIRGDDGKPGANGHDGIAGKDGVGIKTTTITYAISTNGNTAPNTGWTSQVPTLVKGQYLWTKTVWTYTDNSSEIGYSVTYISKDGNNGINGIAGKDGVGIKTTTITYASHTNGTSPPTTGYTTTVPTVPAGQFLWTKTLWTYTDNSFEIGYSVAMMGLKGDKGDQGNNGSNGIAGKDGKGIKATAITYQANTNGTTAPTGTWSVNVPPVPKGSFLWTRTIWTYTDNATETGYAVAYMGTNGNNGHDGIAGKDGVGIKTTTITYAGSTSGTTVPNSGWTSTVPTVAAGSYLWTKTVWAYTDNTIETGYSVGKMGDTGPAGPAGSDGNPGKIVSDTEPTTKFKGLAWKYSGVVDMTLGNGTKIIAGTEYYWNGTAWALYEINAHNINGDNLSVTNGTFKDGKIESVWGGNGVKGTTTIEGSHLQIHSSDSTTNTENTVAIDNRQGYAQVYTDHNTGRAITVQTSFQGFFVSDSTGPYVRVTPNGIKTSSDKSYNSFQIGAGITINLERRGDIVEATLSGSINSPLSSNTKFVVGTIPVGYRPNRVAYIMVHMTSTNNSSHIDVEPNGLCTWWGTSYNAGAPRGNQMWFTDDPLQN